MQKVRGNKMMNLNFSTENAKTKALAAKIETIKRKIRLMDTIAGVTISALTVFVAFILPTLVH